MLENVRTLFRPTPPIPRPSAAVHRTWRPFTTPRNFLIAGAVVFLLGLVLSSGLQGVPPESGLALLGFLLIGAITPLLLALYLFNQDKYEREPPYLMPLLVGWGALSTTLTLVFGFLVVDVVITAPFFEEVFKALGVLILGIVFLKTRDEFNGPMDGLVWGAMAGAGFAIVENSFYILRFAPIGLETIVVLRLLVGPMHVAATAFVCRWLGIVKARYGVVRGRDFLVALVPGFLLHGIWNGLFVNALVVLPGYLLVLRKLAKEFRAIEESWGYTAGRAPVEPPLAKTHVPSNAATPAQPPRGVAPVRRGQSTSRVETAGSDIPRNFCNQCGSPLSSEWAFCMSCGARLS